MKHSDAVIVQTVIGMAKNLGMEVIAEGVRRASSTAFSRAMAVPAFMTISLAALPVADFERGNFTEPVAAS